jgi:hypothetical protein
MLYDARSLFGGFDGIPSFLAERACIFLLGGPSADAVSVVSVVASPPTDETCLTIGYLVGLTFEAGLVDAVLTNGTIFNSYVPTPQGHSVPLLHFDSFVNLHLNHYLLFKYGKLKHSYKQKLVSLERRVDSSIQ